MLISFANPSKLGWIPSNALKTMMATSMINRCLHSREKEDDANCGAKAGDRQQEAEEVEHLGAVLQA